jgi:two-component system, chemotaxis family, sensor kinase CheA
VDTSRYAELFLTESREHLSAINHALLEMEQNGGTAETVGALFRAVHTVKGMSATMGYHAVADLSHELETLLERVRRGELAVTSPLMDVLFTAADTLEAAIENAVADGPAVKVAKIVERLKAAGKESPGTPGNGGAPRRNSGKAARARAAKKAATPLSIAKISGEPGTVVKVTMIPDAPLPGVRAIMALTKVRALGNVVSVDPPEAEMAQDAFTGAFTFTLVSPATAPEIEQALRTVGDIDTVEISGAPAGAVRRGTTVLQAVGDEATGLKQQRHVRIDLRRLDSLMNLIGELVITRGRLFELARGLANPALDDALAQASRLIGDLQDEIMTCRMVPVWQVFDRFPRLVRDAARTLGKDVTLEIEGKEIELDRSMLDEIGDPIVHLLRNAVDHGIESPDERERHGKPPVGRLTLSAARDRSNVLIKVADDGRGIDRAKVLKKAQATGLIDPGTVELTDEELMRLISKPGFSTADAVTEISGRGVGIDAVQNRVRALGGSVDIRTAPGRGTTVTARLPLTLAIMRALLAKVADETYAIPMAHVRETISLDGANVSTLQGKPVLVLREVVMPLVRLRDVVGLPGRPVPTADEDAEQAIVVELADREVAVVVDQLPGQQEIVVKQFDGVRGGLTLFTGATILGDGAPALIVDVSSLF